MNEGIDEFDEFDDEYGTQFVIDAETQDNEDSDSNKELTNESDQDEVDDSSNEESSNDEIIDQFLKFKGIEDSSKIKFENEEGDIEEVDWNSLNKEDKLNILQSSTEDLNAELDDSEVLLINAIRQSLLSPAEYILYIQRNSVETYLRNMQNQYQSYSIDLYDDDELYLMDMLSRTEDLTEEEAIEALERAKSNEVLFKKLIGAIRNLYKKAEEEEIYNTRIQLEQEAQAQFNQFAEQIENSIINFREFSGCELNMNEEDMLDIYDFVTGTDNAGNNWFVKALNDPDQVVKTAYFLLYGEKMILDINDYYQKEITNVRKESYKKGLNDGAKKDTSTITYKPKSKSKNNQTFDDLDNY